jgi:hypothetical protein
MKAMPNPDFAERMMQLTASAGPFEAAATYDPDGDCIEFLAKPDLFYAERVDDLVTVYYSQETGEIVGSLIKSASKFCQRLLERFPGFRIEIIDGRVKLEHLFLARLWSAPPEQEEIITLTYRKLIKVAEEANAEAEVCVS